MKLIFTAILLCVLVGCNESTDILDGFPEARARLQVHIDACGEGVREGAVGENNCLYQIEVNEAFLIPLSQRLGLKKPEGWESERPYVTHVNRDDIMETVKGLAEWDWSKQKQGICGTKNQSSCGSCWWFSTQQTWRNWYKLANPDSACLDIANQWGVDCEPEDYGGCGGGWWSGAKVNLGAVYTADYSKYYASNRRCLTSKVNPDKKTQALKDVYIGSERGQSPTTHEILAALYEFGPVSITERGFNAGKGIYDRCSLTSSTNHMTLLFGWVYLDDAGNKVPAGEGTLFFYRQNSWSTQDVEDSRRTVQATRYSGFKALEQTSRCQNMGRTTVAISDSMGSTP